MTKLRHDILVDGSRSMSDTRAGLQYYTKESETIAIEPPEEIQGYKRYSSSLLEAKNPSIVQRFKNCA